MKRTFQCAFVAATVLMSGSAFAQTFAEKGQLAISAERLFGFGYNSATRSDPGGDVDVSNTTISLLTSRYSPGTETQFLGYSGPRVAGDYFIIDHLSLGAALGYSHWSHTTPGFGNADVSTSGDSFLFSPRVGYALAFSDHFGFWPRGGFTYLTFSDQNVSAHVFALTLEAPFYYTPFQHVAFWAGPTLDLGLTGSAKIDNMNGTSTSFDFKSTEIALQTGMTVYFDL